MLDPLAFVADHAGSPPPRSRTAADDPDERRTYVRWAAGEGLLDRPADAATRRCTRGAWWRMLARGRGRAAARWRARRGAARFAHRADGVLPEEEGGAPGDEHSRWEELARDVKRLREIGVRIPHGPLAAAADHEAACEARFGQRAPASHPGALRRREGEPTLADASLLLADLSGPRPGPQLGPGSAPRACREIAAAPSLEEAPRAHRSAQHAIVGVRRRPERRGRLTRHRGGMARSGLEGCDGDE